MSITIKTGRRAVELTRPDKQLFPCGITKADLARYYEHVAETMLPHVAGRPLNLERYPDGIGGEKIMQQRAGKYFPDWIERVVVPGRRDSVEHVVASDAATLVYLAGQACITLHPWPSRRDRLDRPDRMVIDLDPSGKDPEEVRGAALKIGELMRELGLEPWVMSTGSKGYHVTVALQRRADFDAVRAFARDLALLAEQRDPKLFTSEMRKAKRDGRILIDVMRNAFGHTSVAPYSVRPREHAPVATPLRWEELGERGLRPDKWTLRSVPDRLGRDGDPWHSIAKAGCTLTNPRANLADALAETARTR